MSLGVDPFKGTLNDNNCFLTQAYKRHDHKKLLTSSS